MADDTKPDEPQYTDPKTGKPIIYADNVPELLRQNALEASRIEINDVHLKKMDTKMSVIQRAEQGAKQWNRWVQWAEIVGQRWTVDEERDGLIYRGMKETDGIGSTIEFNQNIPRRVAVHLESLDEFVFPCRVSFQSTNFARRISFGNTVFCSEVVFCSANFGQGATFDATVFRAIADFRQATFHGISTLFSDALFLGYADFAYTKFHENVEFFGVEFEGKACFDECEFYSNVSFNTSSFHDAMRCVKSRFDNSFNANDCMFLGYANWAGATFSRSVNLRNSAFLCRSSFVNCDFRGHVDLDWTHFGPKGRIPKHESKAVPNFGGAKFAVPPNLGYTDVDAPDLKAPENLWQKIKLFGGIGLDAVRISDKKAMSKLRRLQELAADGHHHLAEKRFFRAELLCRRGHEAKEWSEIMMINLFELFSMCGLSFWRPMDWLLRANILFGLVYLSMMKATPPELTLDTGIVSACILGLSLWRPRSFLPMFAALFFFVYWQWGDWRFLNVSGETFRELVIYSGLNSLPVVGLASESYQVSAFLLFGVPNDVPDIVRLTAFIQNAMSAVFLFFALLAIRNYFKLG